MPEDHTSNSNDSTSFQTLLGLVEHYSPTGQEGRAVEWLVERMRTLGYTRAFPDETGNAVGVMGSGPRQVVLLGHIDTVPGEIPVRVEGDRLFGRGSVDAKGPLAVFTEAVAKAGPVQGWQFVVIGAVGEEGDSTGARYAVTQYQPEFAIIGEPSRWERVTLGYKGSAWTEITIRQAMAHTAGIKESACEAAVAAWEAIRGWAESFNGGIERAFDQLLPTLRGFSSGDNGFEEWAQLRTGTRLPPGISPEKWYDEVRQLLPGAEVRPIGYPVSAYQGEKNTPLVRAFLTGIRAAGGKPGFVLKTGTADLNIVAPVWGCPAAAYGPGDSALDHTPHEHISLKEYSQAINVLQATLEQISRGPG
jgi:LysW-gamma-L-lysine carboxypeptidase